MHFFCEVKTCENIDIAQPKCNLTPMNTHTHINLNMHSFTHTYCLIYFVWIYVNSQDSRKWFLYKIIGYSLAGRAHSLSLDWLLIQHLTSSASSSPSGPLNLQSPFFILHYQSTQNEREENSDLYSRCSVLYLLCICLFFMKLQTCVFNISADYFGHHLLFYSVLCK